MLDAIRAAVAEIGRSFQDSRVNFFRVEVTPGEDDGYLLSGQVLDAPTYAAVADGLLERFPDQCFNAEALEILHSPTPEMITVATNLTGLHREPSFGSELLSQLLNGWLLEVLMTDGNWSFVRQADGYLGWAYRPYLAGPAAIEPTHLVAAPVCLLYENADAGSPLVTRVPGGSAVAVSSIKGEWARVALAGDLAGWAAGADLRSLGALPFGEAGRRRQLIADAERFIGVPYLWGGCTALGGIDCSGLVQLLHRLAGVTVPRDADQQYAAGRPVEPPYLPGDLIFFWEDDDPARKITHVAISLGGSQILHSSRLRNGVYVDDVQLRADLRAGVAGARTFLAD